MNLVWIHIPNGFGSFLYFWLSFLTLYFFISIRSFGLGLNVNDYLFKFVIVFFPLIPATLPSLFSNIRPGWFERHTLSLAPWTHPRLVFSQVPGTESRARPQTSPAELLSRGATGDILDRCWAGEPLGLIPLWKVTSSPSHCPLWSPPKAVGLQKCLNVFGQQMEPHPRTGFRVAPVPHVTWPLPGAGHTLFFGTSASWTYSFTFLICLWFMKTLSLFLSLPVWFWFILVYTWIWVGGAGVVQSINSSYYLDYKPQTCFLSEPNIDKMFKKKGWD